MKDLYPADARIIESLSGSCASISIAIQRLEETQAKQGGFYQNEIDALRGNLASLNRELDERVFSPQVGVAVGDLPFPETPAVSE